MVKLERITEYIYNNQVYYTAKYKAGIVMLDSNDNIVSYQEALIVERNGERRMV